MKRSDGPGIPIAVDVYLGRPEFRPRFRDPEILAVGVPMPEAAMHENDTAEFRHYDVRLSGQIRYVQPVSETRRVKPPSQDHFGLCIRGSDARHDL